MTRRAIAAVVVALVVPALLWVPEAVASACPGGSGSSNTGASTNANGILLQGDQAAVGIVDCNGTSEVDQISAPVRDSDLDAACVRQALSDGRNPFAFCDLDPGNPIQLTAGVVAAAFRNLPLPASQLVVQPPGGRTLVNFATNFYTESGPFTRSVNLLGHRVDLRIWQSSFGWRFGDGGQVSTSSAGSPYPDLEITHDYRRAGDVSPSVDTTYAAQFSVNGGPWRDVNGTVTIPGNAVALEVITASPVLVAYE